MKQERYGPGQAAASSPGIHRFAIVCVAATFTLIFVGGLVTSTGSALAVPDWPLAYGHLIPNSREGFASSMATVWWPVSWLF